MTPGEILTRQLELGKRTKCVVHFESIASFLPHSIEHHRINRRIYVSDQDRQIKCPIGSDAKAPEGVISV